MQSPVGRGGAPLAKLGGAVYLAAAGYETELESELGAGCVKLGETGRLFFLAGAERASVWACNVWRNPVRLDASSAAKAASLLRAYGRDWVPFACSAPHAVAIAKLLPDPRLSPIAFPPRAPLTPRSAFTLLGDREVVASCECTSPFPNGEAHFVEDHVGPPSRAYRKLWEALLLLGTFPKPGERCVDLGSSPGGWTWALEKLGARVTSVDKADLAPTLLGLTRVRFIKESAFALDPSSVGVTSWVCSDVICYPDRALRLIREWLRAHPHAGFVITIKLQGDGMAVALAEIQSIPGGRLVHLFHNRHELTWIRAPETEAKHEA